MTHSTPAAPLVTRFGTTLYDQKPRPLRPPEAKRKKHPTEKMTLPTEKAAVSANSNLGTPITGFVK